MANTEQPCKTCGDMKKVIDLKERSHDYKEHIIADCPACKPEGGEGKIVFPYFFGCEFGENTIMRIEDWGRHSVGCFSTTEDKDKFIDEIQRLLDIIARHTKRCKVCGNYLIPDDDSKDIYACVCCAANTMQAALAEKEAEIEGLKEKDNGEQ